MSSATGRKPKVTELSAGDPAVWPRVVLRERVRGELIRSKKRADAVRRLVQREHDRASSTTTAADGPNAAVAQAEPDWWTEEYRTRAAVRCQEEALRDEWFALARSLEHVLGNAMPGSSLYRYANRMRTHLWLLASAVLLIVAVNIGAGLILTSAAAGLTAVCGVEVKRAGGGGPVRLAPGESLAWAALVREVAIEVFGDRSIPGAPATGTMLRHDLQGLYTAWGEAELRGENTSGEDWEIYRQAVTAADAAIDELGTNSAEEARTHAAAQLDSAHAAWRAIHHTHRRSGNSGGSTPEHQEGCEGTK